MYERGRKGKRIPLNKATPMMMSDRGALGHGLEELEISELDKPNTILLYYVYKMRRTRPLASDKQEFRSHEIVATKSGRI